MCNRTLAAFIAGVILPELPWQLLYMGSPRRSITVRAWLFCMVQAYKHYQHLCILSRCGYACVLEFLGSIPSRCYVLNCCQQFVVLHEAVNSSTSVRHSFQQQFMVMRVSAHSSKPFLRDTLSSIIISNLCFYMWL